MLQVAFAFAIADQRFFRAHPLHEGRSSLAPAVVRGAFCPECPERRVALPGVVPASAWKNHGVQFPAEATAQRIQIRLSEHVQMFAALFAICGAALRVARPAALALQGKRATTRSRKTRHVALFPLCREGSQVTPFEQISKAKVVDPETEAAVSPLDGCAGRRSLVVLLPQLGEFDSAEFCEPLAAVGDALGEANIALRVIGIGNAAAARRFSSFTGLPLGSLRVDPEAALHRDLELHSGPRWTAPERFPEALMKALKSAHVVEVTS